MNPPVGIVAGSGIDLRRLLDTVSEERPFSEFPELEQGVLRQGVATPCPRRFVCGACGPYPIVLQCGRLHMYEGLDYEAVVRPVDVLHDLGVRSILFTNAAGGLVPGMAPGDLLAVDRVRLWRYRRWDATPGTLFPDFVAPDCDFTGGYQWVHGPCYETRAEIAALQNHRMAAVGMSTAPGLARCQELGIRAGVIACITNSCCHPHVLTHEEVTTVARRSSGKLARHIRSVLPVIAGPHPPAPQRPGVVS